MALFLFDARIRSTRTTLLLWNPGVSDIRCDPLLSTGQLINHQSLELTRTPVSLLLLLQQANYSYYDEEDQWRGPIKLLIEYSRFFSLI